MKKLVITALAILTVFGLSACGNVQNADKNVETSATTSASANTVTTVTTSSATTSMGDVVTTAPTSTSEGEPIVTTSATTSTAPEEVETTTTTVATKKPVTTTTKKATTTTAKKTTTTAKKTSAKVENVSSNTSKGTTMYTNCTAWIVNIDGYYWSYKGYGEWLKANTKVTVLETKTLDNKDFCRVKDDKGNINWVEKNDLSNKPIEIKLTQSDVDKMVKELQKYSDDVFYKNEGYRVEDDMWSSPDGTSWITYEEHLAITTPENCLNWTFPTDIYPTYSYDEAYQEIKEYIDYNYKTFSGCHIIVYLRWCPNGEGNTNTYEIYDCWEVYAIRS